MTPRAARWGRVLVGAVCLALVTTGVGCSGDGDRRGSATTPSRVRSPAEELPPRTFPELAQIFQPQVAPLGLRLTRASLVEVRNGGPDPLAHHLALYVEPTGPWSDARYVETIVPLTAVFAPSIFDRWPRLSSFDVCQEPPPGVDDRPEPPVVTVVDMKRRLAEAIDWASADLATLVRASHRDPAGVRLQVTERLRQEPVFAEAVARAQGAVTTPAG